MKKKRHIKEKIKNRNNMKCINKSTDNHNDIFIHHLFQHYNNVNTYRKTMIYNLNKTNNFVSYNRTQKVNSYEKLLFREVITHVEKDIPGIDIPEIHNI